MNSPDGSDALSIRRITVFGGSVANGFGATTSFARILSARLGVDIRDCTAPHRYIDWSLEELDHMEWEGDWVLVQHGLAEGLWRTSDTITARLTPRLRQPGGLDPAPYLASTTVRRIRQRARWVARASVKWGALVSGQSYRYMSPDKYESALRLLLDQLSQKPGVLQVTVLGPPRMHKGYFPLGDRSLRQYAKLSRRLAEEHGCTYISPRAILDRSKYLADRFHPNDDGHSFLAEALYRSVAT